jgi:peroxiredoxin
LAEVEQSYNQFLELGVRVLAGNTEGAAETGATAHDHQLSFPVAHSVNPDLVKVLGGWVGERRGGRIMQPSEFVIRPNGEVAASMYATTQLGRMDPQEVLRFVKSRMDQAVKG